MIGRGGSVRAVRLIRLGRRGGLGQSASKLLPSQVGTLLTPITGVYTDCSNTLQYYTSPVCWGKSQDAWIQANLPAVEGAVTAAGPTPTPVPAAAPFGLTTNPPAPASADEANAQINAVLQQSLNQNAANWSQYFAGVQQNLIDFGSPPGPDPACTNIFGNSTIAQWICTNEVLAAAAAGLLLIFLLRR